MLIPYTVESYLFVGANVRGLSNKNYVGSWVTGWCITIQDNSLLC